MHLHIICIRSPQMSLMRRLSRLWQAQQGKSHGRNGWRRREEALRRRPMITLRQVNTAKPLYTTWKIIGYGIDPLKNISLLNQLVTKKTLKDSSANFFRTFNGLRLTFQVVIIDNLRARNTPGESWGFPLSSQGRGNLIGGVR